MSKNRRVSYLLLAFLTLVWGATTASAFYNPQTGRWLNRDPIGLRGGANENAFVLNSPISHYDILGRACGPLVVTDLGHRNAITNVNADGSMDVKSGKTTITSWVLSTVVDRCFPGFSTCQYKVRIRACWASVEYYYDNSTSDKAHEEIHKNDAVNNWNSLVSTAESLAGKCFSQRKAICYQSAIEQYSTAYELEWWASGYELDCRTYSSDPNNTFCVSAREYRRQADDAMAKANATVQRCQSAP